MKARLGLAEQFWLKSSPVSPSCPSQPLQSPGQLLLGAHFKQGKEQHKSLKPRKLLEHSLEK